MDVEGGVAQGRILLALACVGALLVIGYARADDHPSARLVYEREASARQCPDEPELRDLVSARLGYVPFRDDATLVVTTRIEGSARGLRAMVEARNEAGEITGRREIVSRTRDCQELARGVALAISVAIDPFVLMGGAPPVTEDAAVPAPSDAGVPDAEVVDAAVVVEPQPDAAVTIAPEPERIVMQTPVEPAPGFGLALGGAVGMGFGAVPDPRPYFALDAALDHPRFMLRGVVRVDLPASDTRPIGGSVVAWRMAARVDACGVYRFLFGCGGFGARLYVAHGEDVDRARRGTRGNFALTPQIGARIPVSDSLRLHAAFGIDLPLSRISLELDDRAVFRESRVSPFVELGVVWRIP